MKRVVRTAGAACLAVASMVSAQDDTVVRGRIVDEAGQPVEGAEILLEYQGSARRTLTRTNVADEEVLREYQESPPLTLTLTLTTNEKGEYIQVGLRPGSYRIAFQKEGYIGGTIEQHLSGQARLPEFRIVPLALVPPLDEARTMVKEAFARGIDLTRVGSYDEALEAFQEVIEIAPGLAEPHYNKGFIFIQRQEWEAAEASLGKAIELDPGYADAKLALSKLYQDTGRASEALALMTAAAAEETGDARVHFNRGVFNLNAGNTAEALAAFQLAARLDPSAPEVHFYLGTLAVGEGKVDEAVERLERYLSMSPEDGQNKATAEGLLQALKK